MVVLAWHPPLRKTEAILVKIIGIRCCPPCGTRGIPCGHTVRTAIAAILPLNNCCKQRPCTSLNARQTNLDNSSPTCESSLCHAVLWTTSAGCIQSFFHVSPTIPAHLIHMETAEQRKQRLKAMRQAAQETEGTDAPGTTTGDDTTAADENGNGAAPVLKFRNYALRDEKIEHEKVRSQHTSARKAGVTNLSTNAGSSSKGARFSAT